MIECVVVVIAARERPSPRPRTGRQPGSDRAAGRQTGLPARHRRNWSRRCSKRRRQFSAGSGREDDLLYRELRDERRIERADRPVMIGRAAGAILGERRDRNRSVLIARSDRLRSRPLPHPVMRPESHRPLRPAQASYSVRRWRRDSNAVRPRSSRSRWANRRMPLRNNHPPCRYFHHRSPAGRRRCKHRSGSCPGLCRHLHPRTGFPLRRATLHNCPSRRYRLPSCTRRPATSSPPPSQRKRRRRNCRSRCKAPRHRTSFRRPPPY